MSKQDWHVGQKVVMASGFKAGTRTTIAKIGKKYATTEHGEMFGISVESGRIPTERDAGKQINPYSH